MIWITKHCLHEGCPEGKPAVFTFIHCTPLLVEKTGVAPDVTLSFTTSKQVCRWENHPGFETHGQSQPKSKTESTSSSTKWWPVTANLKKKSSDRCLRAHPHCANAKATSLDVCSHWMWIAPMKWMVPKANSSVQCERPFLWHLLQFGCGNKRYCVLYFTGSEQISESCPCCGISVS